MQDLSLIVVLLILVRVRELQLMQMILPSTTLKLSLVLQHLPLMQRSLDLTRSAMTGADQAADFLRDLYKEQGMAMGIAYAGGRPVAEIQFCDYGFNVIDLLKVSGNQRWAGAGNFDMPIVVMTPSGSGIRGSLYHSHSFESWASRLAGWKVCLPSIQKSRSQTEPEALVFFS